MCHIYIYIYIYLSLSNVGLSIWYVGILMCKLVLGNVCANKGTIFVQYTSNICQIHLKKLLSKSGLPLIHRCVSDVTHYSPKRGTIILKLNEAYIRWSLIRTILSMSLGRQEYDMRCRPRCASQDLAASVPLPTTRLTWAGIRITLSIILIKLHLMYALFDFRIIPH